MQKSCPTIHQGDFFIRYGLHADDKCYFSVFYRHVLLAHIPLWLIEDWNLVPFFPAAIDYDKRMEKFIERVKNYNLYHDITESK